MITSGPLADWMAAVMRACRSLALMNSKTTSAPRALEASTACRLSSTSQAGMKSTQRRIFSRVPCAKAGARRAARMPSIPVAAIPTAADPAMNRRRVTPETTPCPSDSGVFIDAAFPRLCLIDLLELALRPLHGILGLHALAGLGVHVDDDVLRIRLRGLGRRRPRIAQHPRLARGLPEDLEDLVGLAPHLAILTGLGRAEGLAHRLALGLELLAHLAPLVPGLGELLDADLCVPGPPVGDGVSARAVRDGQPAIADLRGAGEHVVVAALRLADGLGHVRDVHEAVGIEMRPVPEHLDDVGAAAGLDGGGDAGLEVVGVDELEGDLRPERLRGLRRLALELHVRLRDEVHPAQDVDLGALGEGGRAPRRQYPLHTGCTERRRSRPCDKLSTRQVGRYPLTISVSSRHRPSSPRPRGAPDRSTPSAGFAGASWGRQGESEPHGSLRPSEGGQSPPPSLSLVDLLELAFRPLHGVLGLHALDALGIHVGHDVLREALV